MGGSGEYVTWPWFIKAQISAFVFYIGLIWAVLTNHAAQPHDGAARRHDLADLQEYVQQLHLNQAGVLDNIQDDIREVRQMLLRLDADIIRNRPTAKIDDPNVRTRGIPRREKPDESE